MRDVCEGGSLEAIFVRRSSVIWASTSAGLKVLGVGGVVVVGLGDEGEGGEGVGGR